MQIDMLRSVLLNNPIGIEGVVKTKLFDLVILASQEVDGLEKALATTFTSIQLNSLATNASLVSTCIWVWPLIYPNCEERVLSALLKPMKEGSDLYSSCGEGLMIGLLHIFRESGDDTPLFEAIHSGDLLSLLRKSSVTNSGKALLSSALSRFVRNIYDSSDAEKSTRLAKIILFLRRCRSIFGEGSALVFPNRSFEMDTESTDFFSHFALELATRTFLAAGRELRLIIVTDGLVSNKPNILEAWEKMFPRLTCRL
jgi:hypothetical protein